MSPSSPRRPWIEAIVAALLGLVLFIFDDIWPHTSRSEPILSVWTEWLELAVLSLGLGLLAWFAFRYHHLRARMLADRLIWQRNQRFAVLGRLAGSVAHEIRNPLHNARLLVEALAEPDGEHRSELLQRLEGNLGRIDRAVDLVYLLARPSGDGQRETVDLTTLLRLVVDDLPGDLLVAAVSLALPNEAMASSAADRLRIILDNLIRNAAQAAQAQGQQANISLEAQPHGWRIRVANPGIAPPWLIDPSAPIPPGGGGLGLGLSISRQLAEQLGHPLSLRQQGTMVVAELDVVEIES